MITMPKLPQLEKLLLVYPVPVKIEIILNKANRKDEKILIFWLIDSQTVLTKTIIRIIRKNNFIWSSLKKNFFCLCKNCKYKTCL